MNERSKTCTSLVVHHDTTDTKAKQHREVSDIKYTAAGFHLEA